MDEQSPSSYILFEFASKAYCLNDSDIPKMLKAFPNFRILRVKEEFNGKHGYISVSGGLNAGQLSQVPVHPLESDLFIKRR